MEYVCIKLTVLFEDPFYVGLCERHDEQGYAVCRIVFGAEPKDHEIHHYILTHWYALRFSPNMADAAVQHKAVNPKRMQRIARRQMNVAVSTKAQLALQAQREESKQNRRESMRNRRDEQAAYRFALRCEKRREKHKGH